MIISVSMVGAMMSSSHHVCRNPQLETEIKSSPTIYENRPSLFADALVPKIVVEDMVGDALLLRWKLILPEEEKDSCTLWIWKCHIESDRCSETGITDIDSRSAWLFVTAFESYNLTMQTHCVFFKSLTVDTVSDTLNVSIASRKPSFPSYPFISYPFIPRGSIGHDSVLKKKTYLQVIRRRIAQRKCLPLQRRMRATGGKSISGPPALVRLLAAPKTDTCISVRWKVENHQKHLYSGFIIRWTKVGNDSWRESNATSMSFKIENLEPATRYNISVAGYRIYGEERLMSDRSFTTGTSLFPGTQLIEKLYFGRFLLLALSVVFCSCSASRG